MPNKRGCDQSRILLVSKNSRIFENSRKKGITNHSTRWTRSFSPDITNNALTFICFQAAIFSEPKKGERERQTEKSGEGKKTKQKYERWIIKIPLSGENDALEHECCSSLHHRSRFAEIYDMAVGIAHKTNFKTVRSATYRERKRERDEGMAVAKTTGNQRKINKEWERRGSNGRGRTRAIFPLFVFHYSAEGSCPLPAWNIARQW